MSELLEKNNIAEENSKKMEGDEKPLQKMRKERNFTGFSALKIGN